VKNYYQLLGLNDDSTLDEIKKSYKMYAIKIHPDKHSGDKFFEERFKEVLEAYEILSDDFKRKQYDINLKRSNYTLQDLRNKDSKLKKKEEELNNKEIKLLKKERELKAKQDELAKKEENVRKQSNDLFLNKIKNDEKYFHIDVKVPRPTVKKVVVKAWLKNVGDYIKIGEPIARLQTEMKDFFEIKSDAQGFIIYTSKLGETLDTGSILAILSK